MSLTLCLEEVARLQPLLRTSNSCGERRTFKPNFLRLFHYNLKLDTNSKIEFFLAFGFPPSSKNKSHLMKKNQVVVRVWGNVSLLPSELQVLVQEITSRTKNNTGPRMNICFPYTSTDEMITAHGVLHRLPWTGR